MNIDDANWVEWNGIDEQAWYWWWNGDLDSTPVPVSVLYSYTDQKYFASTGQLGWTRPQDVDEMGGWWLKIKEPEIPDELLKKGFSDA